MELVTNVDVNYVILEQKEKVKSKKKKNAYCCRVLPPLMKQFNMTFNIDTRKIKKNIVISKIIHENK